jgi:hypothetical protein
MLLAVVSCQHWQPGVCAAGHNAGRASVALCASCPHYVGPAARFGGATVEGPDVGPPKLGGIRREPFRTDFPAMWAELHRRPFSDTWAGTAAEEAWFARWCRSIGCGDCSRHWHGVLREMPPVFSPPDAYFEWTVAAHNAVNARLNRPPMSLDDARQRWMP